MPMTVEDRVFACKSLIESACITTGLNLTVYDGKIAFVDQTAKKIVAEWTPEYSMSALDNG